MVSVPWYTHKEIQTKNFKVELYLVDMHKEIIHRDLHFCSQLSSSALLKDFPFALQSLGESPNTFFPFPPPDSDLWEQGKKRKLCNTANNIRYILFHSSQGVTWKLWNIRGFSLLYVKQSLRHHCLLGTHPLKERRTPNHNSKLFLFTVWSHGSMQKRQVIDLHWFYCFKYIKQILTCWLSGKAWNVSVHNEKKIVCIYSISKENLLRKWSMKLYLL